MSSYSKSEKIIAVALSNIPFLRRLLKKLYQRLNYLIYKKGITFNCEYPLKQIGDKTNESFFGYYDKSPVNKTGQYLIYQETGHPTIKKPDSKKSVNVVLYNNILDKEIKRWESCAYNWQQGAKLMWISDYKFVFNDYNEITDKYFSRIIDVNNLDAVQNISSPIYDANAIYALTLSFERLNSIMPDYGYRNHKQKRHFDYKREGIHKIDLEKDTKELLISIQQIIDLHHNKTMDRGKHWINHIMLSPDGERFMFLHRWISRGRKYDALILSDTNGANVKCLADDGMVSHCYWINNSEIISYMRDANHGDKYYRINTKDGSRAIIGANVIDNLGDGHPGVFNNKLVFDTYPDRSRLKELFLFDLESNNLTKIGEFFESLKYNEETRCDLHPKFAYSGKSIFIDSVHTGKRMLYQIDFK